MTTNLERQGVADDLGLDPAPPVRQDSMQQADGAERAELQRAQQVYGMAGALGAEHARSAKNEKRA